MHYNKYKEEPSFFWVNVVLITDRELKFSIVSKFYLEKKTTLTELISQQHISPLHKLTETLFLRTRGIN